MMAADGKVIDLTALKGKRTSRTLPRSTARSVSAKAKRKYARMVLTNGHEELSDPFELEFTACRSSAAPGAKCGSATSGLRFGLVRFARDPQRSRTTGARSCRNADACAAGQLHRASFGRQGPRGDWPNTLIHNDGAQAPVQTTLQNLAALLSEEEMCSNDMKETTGIHEAELGMKSNETSGVAIRQRQQQGDLATIIYHDNMNAAMQEAGEVLNALIPIVYDTARTIRTVGVDEASSWCGSTIPTPRSISTSPWAAMT
jgi:hypothetical protein